MNPIFKKLNYKDQEKIYILRAPKEFKPAIAEMKDICTVKGSPNCKQTYDFVMYFVKNRADIEKYAPKAHEKCNEDAVLWFAYPKQTSKNYRSDINRDTGWESLTELGYKPVRQVSIDDDWSALRFRMNA